MIAPDAHAPPSTPPPLIAEAMPQGRIWRTLATVGWGAAALVILVIGAALARLIAPGLTTGFDLSEAPQTSNRLIQDARVMASLAAILGAWAALTLAGAALIHRRRWSSFLWVGSRPSFGQLGAGLAVGCALGVALLFGYGWLENEPLLFPAFDATYPLDQRVVYALSAVVALFVAALAEEVLFRGLVLQMTAAFTRRVAAICLINGLLFAALHLYADPVVFLSLALSGALWAWVTLELGGIAFATGAHLAHNLCLALLAEPFTLNWNAAPSASPILLVFDLIMVLVVAVAVKTLKAGAGAAAGQTVRP